MQPCIAPEFTNDKLPSEVKTQVDGPNALGLIPEWHEVNRGEGGPTCWCWNHLGHHCLLQWSHAGLNRGPYGYWPYALTS